MLELADERARVQIQEPALDGRAAYIDTEKNTIHGVRRRQLALAVGLSHFNITLTRLFLSRHQQTGGDHE